MICFSPHPDDDVISMGGTLIRLVEDGHEVHIAYMTSGNIAVFDHDAARVADLVTEYNRLFGIDQERSKLVEGTVLESLARKHAGDCRHRSRAEDQGADPLERGQGRGDQGRLPRGAPALPRPAVLSHRHDRQEADRRRRRADHPRAARAGRAAPDLRRRRPVRPARHAPRLRPGDLSGPARTSKPSAAAGPRCCSIAAPGRNTSCTRSRSPCRSSPGDLLKKRKAIFMHQSQKDEALFPGSDPREFWQRAEDRNTNTAAGYNQLGLPEYFAMEAFVRWNGVAI